MYSKRNTTQNKNKKWEQSIHIYYTLFAHAGDLWLRFSAAKFRFGKHTTTTNNIKQWWVDNVAT